MLKGPTAACMAWAGESADAAGVAAHYGELIDAIVADEPVADVPALRRDTWMGTAERAASSRRHARARASAARMSG